MECECSVRLHFSFLSVSLDPFELPHFPCLILLFIVLIVRVDHLLLLMH